MCVNLKDNHSIKWTEINQILGFAGRNMRRWRERKNLDRPIINKPGPKKCPKIDVSVIEADILKIGPGNKRMKNSTSLLKKYASEISRRDFREIIHKRRLEIKVNQKPKQLIWNTPGLVWAIDETELKQNKKKKAWVDLREMTSQFKFEPLLGLPLTGGRIAPWLKAAFSRYGPPLFLKRDNGPALNSSEVNDVLNDYSVLPLNSPVYYSKYNGAIEHDHSEIKKEIGPKLSVSQNILSLIVTRLNHKIRRSLRGKNSCSVFSSRDLSSLNKRSRLSIFESIKHRAQELYETLKTYHQQAEAAAWRLSCEEWLVSSGHLTIKEG